MSTRKLFTQFIDPAVVWAEAYRARFGCVPAVFPVTPQEHAAYLKAFPKWLLDGLHLEVTPNAVELRSNVLQFPT